MGAWQQQARCRERLERLAASTLDCESIQREAITNLQRLVGFDRWCWPLADPKTLLPLGGVGEHDYGPRLPRALELEYSGGDFAAKDVLARRANSAGSLSTETGGDLARSPRWDEVMRPVGIGDIAVVACRDAQGCWGWVEAYRDSDDRPFRDRDLEFLATAGPALGAALRRGLGFTPPPDREAAKPSTTGVIVLNADLRVVETTAGARAWIGAFPAAGLFAAWGMLPATIYPVATRARAGKAATGAHALERMTDGRWVMVEAAPLEERAQGEIAVHPARRDPTRDFRPALPHLRTLATRARTGRSTPRRPRHSRGDRTPLHLSPHRPGPPQIGIREDEHPQPP